MTATAMPEPMRSIFPGPLDRSSQALEIAYTLENGKSMAEAIGSMARWWSIAPRRIDRAITAAKEGAKLPEIARLLKWRGDDLVLVDRFAARPLLALRLVAARKRWDLPQLLLIYIGLTGIMRAIDSDSRSYWTAGAALVTCILWQRAEIVSRNPDLLALSPELRTEEIARQWAAGEEDRTRKSLLHLIPVALLLLAIFGYAALLRFGVIR